MRRTDEQTPDETIRRARENLLSHLNSIDSRLISAQVQAGEADLIGSGISNYLEKAQSLVSVAMVLLQESIGEGS